MKQLKINRIILPALVIGLALFGVGVIAPNHAASAAAACSNTPNSANGTDSMTVTVPSSGNYYVWTRIQAPSSSANSVYMQVDGGCATEVGGSSSIPANTWTWVNYENGSTSSPISTSLSAGTHTILLTGIGAGVEVDRILFLSDQSCTPSGTGSNCTVTTYDPPTISITSPASGATVTGSSVNLAANAADDDSTISSVQFKIDGTVVNTDTTYPYSYTWSSTSATDGSHTLVTEATNAAGQTTSAQESFNVANHTCSSAPSAPAGLKASANGEEAMSLSWSASTASTGCSISGYKVYRNGTLVGSPTTPSYADSGLTPDTIYQYYVESVDNGGHTSSASGTVSGSTAPDTTPPSVPTAVAATATSSSAVKLTWGASTDNVAVSGYRIYRNSVLYATVTAPNTSYTDNDVSANTDYSYAVSAIDTSSNESAKTNATPYPVHTPAAVDTTPPSAPSGLIVALSTSDTVTLEWTASTDNTAVAGYHVYRNGSLLATVSSTSYTDTGLSASTKYTYYVVAYDTSANLSSASSTLSATTQAGTVTVSNGDVNGDGVVNYLDLSIMLSHWSSTSATPSQGDLNSDHIVNYLDLSIMLSHWGSK
jgi:chitodextrinase